MTASIHIEARPDEVYEYFTRSDAMEAWMGQFARLDPVIGGEFAVDIEGTAVRGRYLELDPPKRLVVSWGFAGSDELPAGASTVQVDLLDEDGGTRVEITHTDLPEPRAAGHETGWHHFLGRLRDHVAHAGSA